MIIIHLWNTQMQVQIWSQHWCIFRSMHKLYINTLYGILFTDHKTHILLHGITCRCGKSHNVFLWSNMDCLHVTPKPHYWSTQYFAQIQHSSIWKIAIGFAAGAQLKRDAVESSIMAWMSLILQGNFFRHFITPKNPRSWVSLRDSSSHVFTFNSHKLHA